MKDLFRLPILLVFIFALLFILLFALNLLALWGSVYSEGREAALRVVGASIPRLLIQVLPAAVLLSMTFLLIRIALKPERRLLSLVVPLAGAFVLLAFGYQILAGLGGAGAWEAIEPTARRYLVPGMFNAAESKVIYIEDIDDDTVSPVVLAESGNADRKLLYFPQGRFSIQEEAVSLSMAGYVLETDPDPVFSRMFAEDPVLKGLFNDVNFLNEELRRVFSSSLPALYFTVLCVVLAFYASGFLLRLTRWHLLNLALTLLALRGLLALLRFMREDVVFELGKILDNPQTLQLLPEAALLVLGGLLLLLDLLFVPFRRGEEG
ncbi:MAG: hypothetical protein JXB06_10145 [Spirochaetales bacterium]|nr:hypothetical protein [Spirochaetales bacterium]